jgi:16S rRNA (cytosine1402-N4)-methyltransferase
MKRRSKHNRTTRDAGTAPVRPHTPVLLTEVLAALDPRDGETYIDATFGAGGYTRAILDAAGCQVLALDRDPSAISAATPMLAEYPTRLQVVEARFSAMTEVAHAHLPEGITPQGIVFDLGVSSMQLDEAERGFSFQIDGPLDMRMGHARGTLSEGAGPSAAEVVNTSSEEQIADIIYQLGEERRSRAVAAAIVRRRLEHPFERTGELAGLVAKVPGTQRPDGKHPATRTFQALRIWVNDELGEVARALAAAEALLAPGGRLVVVTFHSLEDRIVKRFFADRTGRGGGKSRHIPGDVVPRDPSFRFVNSKSLIPGKDEVAGNPRARSARLRSAVRTEAPPSTEFDISVGLPEITRQA